MLVLSVLQSNDDAIAIKYGFHSDGTVYYYTTGFSPDDEWKRFRLGMILDFQVIEDGFRDGVRRLDFMRGESHYKDHYKMDTLLNQDLLVFRNKRAQLQYQLALSARRRGGELRRKLVETRAKLRKAA